MFYSQFVPTGLVFELHMLQKTFRLSTLMLLLCPLISSIFKKVNSPEAGQDPGKLIQEGPEDEHFVYDITFKDNLQFVNSKFLKNIKMILKNSNCNLVELHSTSLFTNSQSTVNSTVYEPYNNNYDYFDEELNELLPVIDLKDFLQSSSPDSYQFWELLSQENEST